MAKPSRANQDEAIQVEIDRILDLFGDISDDERQVILPLAERVAFMTITLEILEDTIKLKGPTYTFVQGKQRMIIENPAQKSYNVMINRYTAAYKQLMSYLPQHKAAEVGDGFDEFASTRDE